MPWYKLGVDLYWYVCCGIGIGCGVGIYWGAGCGTGIGCGVGCGIGCGAGLDSTDLDPACGAGVGVVCLGLVCVGTQIGLLKSGLYRSRIVIGTVTQDGYSYWTSTG